VLGRKIGVSVHHSGLVHAGQLQEFVIKFIFVTLPVVFLQTSQ